MDLQPEMRDMLMRNGMQAHVVGNGEGYQLVVQGHDSPLLTYNISEPQLLALTDWGTNYANKKAYNTFTAIVGNDFYMPKNFVHARNTNGRVAMGLHGYRVGAGEYGRVGVPRGGNPPFLGWAPRSQEGFHLRRVGGRLFFPEAPMVAERWDGRMKPGEMQSGGYGFYYKGQQQPVQRDVLQDLQSVITPIETRPRSTEPAKPYKELITSPVYFSNEKWQECLSSHGIIVDAQAKKLTIQSNGANADMVYDLTDEEVKALTSNSIKAVPIEKRLEVLNNVIKDDFADKISFEDLNLKSRIDIKLNSEVEKELQQKQEILNPQEQDQTVKQEMQQHGDASVNGQDVDLHNENKGWYREGAHGREVEVGEIFVEKMDSPSPTLPQGEGAKYRMTAIIMVRR